MSDQSPTGPENSSPTPDPDLRRRPALPAARGLAWFSGGFSLLRAQPLRLLLLGLLLQFLAGLTQVGVFGAVFIIAMPALTAGLLEGLRLAHAGRRPPVLTLFAAFRGSGVLAPLLLMGVITLGAAVLAVGMVLAGSISGLSPDLLARIQGGDAAAVAELDPAIVQRVLMALVIGLFVSAAISFYAVPLIWFGRVPLGRAIGKGLVALVREWRALLLLGLLLIITGLPVGLAVGAMMAAQMVSAAPSPLLTLVLVIVMVAYQLLAFACQYLSFRDVFAMSPPAGPEPEGGDDDRDDQLVA